MKKTVLFFVLTLCTGILFGQKITTKNYPLTNYNSISLIAPLDIELKQSSQEGITITCDERLHSSILLQNDNKELKILFNWNELGRLTGSKHKNISINKKNISINKKEFVGNIKIVVNVKDLQSIKTLSSGNVEWEEDMTVKNLTLMTLSSGDIKWSGTLSAENLDISSLSSGDIEGDCKSKSLKINLQSSGNYQGDIETENLTSNLLSSGDFIAKVNALQATFILSSAGDAKVKGDINNLYVKALSSGDFLGSKINYQYAETENLASSEIHLSNSGNWVNKSIGEK